MSGQDISDQDRIAVAGAGAIGGWVGGQLLAAGRRVRFLARGRIIADFAAHGLTLTDLEGRRAEIAPERIAASEDPAQALAGARVVLVCVKSGDTEAMGALISAHAPGDAVVVSLQNGVRNPDRLRALLPGRDVRGGMTPYAVAWRGRGWLHRATSGEIAIEAGRPDVAAALCVEGLPMKARGDILALQWGKALLNLNNALNALSGLALREELLDRRWRGVLALCQAEALALLAAAGMAPAGVGKAPPALLPHLMRLPTPVFRPLFDRIFRIDATAKSSMLDDLERGRMTEIDDLQGEIVALAQSMGRRAPANEAVRALIRKAEAAKAGSPRLAPETVAQAIAAAARMVAPAPP